MIKRIGVVYHLQVDEDVDRSVVERVLGFHADKCPVARSVQGAIEVHTSVRYEDAPPA